MMKSMNTITSEIIQKQIVKCEYQKMGKKTMVCLLTLENGFEIVGSEACVDPDNFNETIGKGYAYQKAIDKVWELEGYALQKELFKEGDEPICKREP